MRKGFQPLVSLASAVIAAILFGTSWALWTGPAPLGSARLPDGAMVRLEAVTFGPRHRIDLSRDWQRVLAPLFPAALRSQSGGPTVEYQGAPPGAAVFWFTSRGMPPFTGVECTREVAYDEKGDTVPLGSSGHSGGSVRLPGPPGSGNYVSAWAVPVFPRRGHWIGLLFYGPDGTTPIADFRVRNPALGRYPTWQAGSLPQTRYAGSLAVTLTHLAAGPLPRGGGMGTQLAMRVTERGQLTQRWEPVGLILSDATGNLLVPSSLGLTSSDGSARLQFPGILPMSEPVWKVRAEFAPSRDFSPDDLLTVRGLTVPGGTLTSGPRPPAMTVSVSRYGVSQQFRVQLRQAPWHKDHLPAEISEPSPVDGVRIGLIRVTDEQGRSWQPARHGPVAFYPSRAQIAPVRLAVGLPSRPPRFGPPGELGIGYELPAPPGARRLNLIFAVVKSRFVDFLARPAAQ